jgi:hypothetical protein
MSDPIPTQCQSAQPPQTNLAKLPQYERDLWQERPENAEAEYKQWKLAFPTAKSANEVAGWLQEKKVRIKSLEAELADVQAREAALRRALSVLVEPRISCADGQPATHAWLTPETRQMILDALSTPAPRVYTREEVGPLLHCAKMAAEACGVCTRVELVTAGREALKHAYSIGLLKDTP